MVSQTSSIKTPEDQAIATPFQFSALFDVAVFSFTLEADTMPSDSGGGEAQEVVLSITVPGAALGDFVFISPAVDVVGTSFVAYVTAANTVTLQIENLTGTDSTAFDTATKGFVGLILRFKPNVIYDLKD
ncbi:hypothetical protein LCGC14_1366980 [marine sediment metagenome]|uniref:Uncharacterized protein n=1 Tax=marine sediment metagenome TaxID=412755 RepID=A0A0F9N8F9_9ZZZZ